MSHLFGSSQPKVIPEYTGLQVNTAVQVLPIPIIYGSPRIQINLIYYNGFRSEQISSGGGGGKGILSGGKGGGSSQTEYFATFLACIGEGQLGDIKIVYQDQNVWTPETYPTNGAFYFTGTDDQTPWDYIITNWPDDARSYKDTAYWAFSGAQLDASATVPQLNLVVRGFGDGTCPLNPSVITISTGQYNPDGSPVSYLGDIDLGFADADPAFVIYDYMTNARYGATFPAQFINANSLFTSSDGFDPLIGDSAISTYCQAVGLAWSVVFSNPESANSTLDKLCKNLSVAPVWDGALLTFTPYWDRSATQNPGWDPAATIPKKYFTPNVTSVVSITTDQILQSEDKEEDPITFTLKDPLEIYNTVRLSFKDRTNFFNDNPVTAIDDNHVELYGPRVDNISDGTEFSLITYANQAVTLALRRNISVTATYTWRMGPLWGWLRPMLLVNIPNPVDFTKNITVRITTITDDEDENITVEAENFPVGAQSPAIIPMALTTPPNQGALNVPGSVAYPPVMFTPPTGMLTATGFASPQWIFGTSGGNSSAYPGLSDPNWGGCNIWISLNNADYQQIGTLTGPSIVGSLTQTLPGYGGVNPDEFDTMFVNLSQCAGVLSSVTADAAAAGHSICCLQDVSGFEIIAFTTATLVGDFTYALTGLYRGMYGTTSRTFGSGSKMLYVGSVANIFEIALPPGYYGQNFWVKPQSFNSLRNWTQDLADTTAYPSVAQGPTPVPPIPPPPGLVTGANRRRKILLENQLPIKRRLHK